MIPIVQKDNPVLRKVAKEVPEKSINGKKIAVVLARMKKALDSQEDGVAIAAPQIGESQRIFLISGKVLAKIYAKEKEENPKPLPDMVFINPKLVKCSKTKMLMEEGCLSVRYLYGKVSRSTKASVEARNEKGEKFTRGASGLLAQIFQHETDHLNGALFIDTAVDVKEIPPETAINN